MSNKIKGHKIDCVIRKDDNTIEIKMKNGTSLSFKGDPVFMGYHPWGDRHEIYESVINCTAYGSDGKVIGRDIRELKK